MKSFYRPLVALLAGASFLTSCKENLPEAKAPTTYPYQIATTIGMITDVTRNVVGDPALAKVNGLIGEGIDPHLYTPTRNDLVALQNANVIFYNGLKLEGKMEDVLAKVAKNGKLAVGVSTPLEKKEGYLVAADSSHADPHVWMDVAGWKTSVETISRTLQKFDNKNADQYRENTKTYLKKLDRLDSYARDSIATIPANQRVLVTAHDAFGYMARAYGLEVRGIQGISTESEAGVKDIENLVDFLVSEKIPAVFVESSVSDKNVRALLEGARARGHQVKIGGTLYSDAMGPSGSYQGTYIGMIDHNVTTITRALGGTAPPQGLNGRLN